MSEPQTNPFVAAFAAGVADAVRTLETLLPIMQEERLALTGRNAESLQAIVARKQAMLQSLEQSMRERDLLLARTGLPTGADGVRQFLAHCGDATLAAACDRLAQLGRQLNLANEMNGQLAAQGLRATRGALAVLTGRTEEQPVYAPRGKRARSTASYQSLGRV